MTPQEALQFLRSKGVDTDKIVNTLEQDGYDVSPLRSPFEKAKSAFDQYQKFPNPVNMLIPGAGNPAVDAIQKGADYLGEKIATAPSLEFMNPTARGIAGGIVATAPDIAMTMMAPEVNDESLAKGSARAARRFLGYKSGQLQTPFARGQAARASQVALEENVVPHLGNVEEGFARAQALKNRAGAALEGLRATVEPNLAQVYNKLDELRHTLTKGSSGGKFDAIHSAITQAQDTVTSLYNRPNLTLNDITEAKNVIKGTVNFLSDSVAQGTTKKMVAAIEQSNREMFKAAGGDIAAYRNAASKYEAAKSMSGALNREIAGQQGNSVTSLPSLIMAAGAGTPVQAAERLGLWELARRRGAGILANEIPGLSQYPKLGGAMGLSANQIFKTKTREENQ